MSEDSDYVTKSPLYSHSIIFKVKKGLSFQIFSCIVSGHCILSIGERSIKSRNQVAIRYETSFYLARTESFLRPTRRLCPFLGFTVKLRRIGPVRRQNQGQIKSTKLFLD